MSQGLSFGVLSGSGIVGFLFVAGIVMYVLNIPLGALALVAAIVLALVFGLLGFVGVSKRVGII